jgi:hypothetical protein
MNLENFVLWSLKWTEWTVMQVTKGYTKWQILYSLSLNWHYSNVFMFEPTTPISLRRWRSHNICTKGNRTKLTNTCTALDSYIIIFYEYIPIFWVNLFITWYWSK